MNFTLAELTRLKLEPGEVLSVKLYGDDYDDVDVQGLQKSLQNIFPNNKIMMFVLPTGKDLQLEVVSGKLENNENTDEAKLKHELEKAELLAKIQAMNCSNGYCNDCSCGKKAAAEATNDLTESES